MTTTFTDADYAAMSDEMEASATAAVPVIYRWLAEHPPHPPGKTALERVIDVGCGPGWWANRFAAMGCQVTAIDGPDGGKALAPGIRYLEDDVGTLPPYSARYDVAVCLEVAEHLPPQAATNLIAALMRLAPIVVFSAAVPGQGGVGHINERWQHEWARMFDGWETTAALRDELWYAAGVAPYYPQNMFVAFDYRALEPPVRPVTPVIHPGVWAHVTRRGTWP
jgi:SAM-dependent methyltransferase